jgi:gamma-glutamyltranspeptidase/glutathione hydrolase
MFGISSSGSEFGWERRRIGPVYAERGMVGAAHPLITATGVDVLQRGGNAVDAAVAAGITAAVVMPEMCGLGGDLFAIVHDPRRGTTLSFLGSGISPRAATIEQMRAAGENGKMPFRGPHAVGVPGMVDAYFALLGEFGTKRFADLAQHGVHYARHGYPLTTDGAEAIQEQEALLSSFEASAAVFLAGGRAPRAGERFTQTDLAATLEAIAQDGPDTFYRGAIGRRIIDAMQALGGAMSLNDFAGHRTEVTPPLQTTYRGHGVYQTGIPSQGMIMLEMLNIIEAAGPAARAFDDAWLHRLIEAKKLAYADRMAFAVDPLFGSTPMDELLSHEWAKRRAAEIDPERAATEIAVPEHAVGDTTYLCTMDSSGMMVSLIQSVSAAFGCGMVAGDTGVVLNNRVGRGFSLEPGHPNIFEPGKKTMHTLNCFLVADETGQPVLTGGTPGGDGQPQWNAQFITNVIDFGMDVQAAIEAPRWTSWPGTDPSTLPNPFELRIESRIDGGVIEGLARRGHTIKRQGAWSGGGSSQAIVRDPKSGVMAGATDPRVEGMVVGF